MIAKVLMLFVLKQCYVCDYIICMTVQLSSYLDNDNVVNFKIYLGSTFKDLPVSSDSRASLKPFEPSKLTCTS